MTVQIGDQKLAVRTPDDLNAAVAHTGLSAEEVVKALRAGGFARHVATALHPFLAETDRPSVADLAALIAAHDVDDVRAQVVALYEAKAEKAK